MLCKVLLVILQGHSMGNKCLCNIRILVLMYKCSLHFQVRVSLFFRVGNHKAKSPWRISWYWVKDVKLERNMLKMVKILQVKGKVTLMEKCKREIGYKHSLV